METEVELTPSGSSGAGSGVVGLLRVLIALSLIIPLLLFAVASWVNYEAAIADAQRDLARTSEVAREHAAKVFDGLDQLADRMNDLVRDETATTIAGSERAVHDAMAGIVGHLPQVQSVMIVGLDGVPLASAAIYPVPKDVNVRQRDYFRGIVDGHATNYISELQIGDVYRFPFFGLSRAWLGASGELKGVIDVAVSPTSFREFYGVLLGERGNETDGNVVTLVRSDGQILTRFPPLPSTPPRAGQHTPFIEAIASNPNGGSYRASSIVGGEDRYFSYRKVPDFPIYVVAGRSRNAILAGWIATMARHLVFGLPATIALVALGWTALVRTRREQRAMALAEREMRRREMAEDSLLRAQRLEAVAKMTGGVAHDFNNLLTIIVGNAEMLERRADDPARVRRLAGNVLTAARRGAEVTQKLLAFSRRQLVRPQTINLNRSLSDLEPVLSRPSENSGSSVVHSIALDLDTSIDPVRLDPGQFEAAIFNLVSNARDAMADGGLIRISTRSVTLGPGEQTELPPGAYVRVAVADSGIGMDPPTAARAVEPFVTTKPVGKGTGLGLSQVYGFVKQAGGDLRIESAVGQGTTIEMLLPRSDQATAVERPGVDIIPLRHAREGEVILVVEDEPNVLEMAVESLQELGYLTRTASDAQAALRELRGNHRIDVLFSDIVMPGGMNGVQLSVEARRLRPTLKVLLTSGYTTPEVGRDMPDDVPLLTKPYDRHELAAHLQAVLST